MKVWLVMFWDHDNSMPDSVWSTEELADERVKTDPEYLKSGEMEVDPPVDPPFVCV